MTYIFIALNAIVWVVAGMWLASLLSGYNLWKVFVISTFSVTMFCAITLLYDRKMRNWGVNGDWGVHGILPEFLNSVVWLGSLGIGAGLSLCLIYAIYSGRSV